MNQENQFTKNLYCNDIDGNVLNVGDVVVLLDIEELEGDVPNRADVLMVSACTDAESNYIHFNDGKYGFFGHRVLKLNYKVN